MTAFVRIFALGMALRGIHAKKSLGQNFLRDPNIARNIVSLVDPQPGDLVLEIGPGLGALTELLLKSAARIIAVELDQRAVSHLKETLGERAEIIHMNILDFDIVALSTLAGRPVRVVGNIPYNITSPLLFQLFDAHRHVRDAVLMMQREVAERLVSRPGTKEYGILSVMAQTHGDVRIAFKVSPNVFVPKPDVWSCVIHYQPHNRNLRLIQDYDMFKAIVRGTFGQRRKTLHNSLKSIGIDTARLPDLCPIDTGRRPEQLTVEEFIHLANFIRHYA